MSRKRERGVALLAMLAVVALVGSYFLVSRLNAESGGAIAATRNRNALVLNQAKQALIGYVAVQAAKAGENNPGRLPCPEALGNFGDPANEGTAAGNCSLPSVGRLPWRTVGLDKLVDAAGESLWYVVSTGWALSNSTSPPLTTYINSNSTGQLLVNARSVSALSQTAGLATAVSTAHGFRTGDIVKIAGAAPAGYNVAASVTVMDANTFTYLVDSALSTPAAGSIKAGDAAVALIIAPGPAMNVAASADCAARSQARGVPNALDYLECYDAANGVFSTTGPAASFNDQVVRVTVADIMPAIEAAIAHRVEREIVPELKTVYADSQWGAGINATNPMFPFAAPFANPGPGTGTSNFQGTAGTYQGLLPFNETQCTAAASNPRCLPALVQWSAAPAAPVEVLGYGYIQGTPSCTPPFSPTMSQWECTGEYHEDDATMPLPVEPWRPIRIEMTATFTNVAMGLRAIDTTKMMVEARDDVALGPWQPQAVTYTATMNSNGSLTITFGATLPNIDVMGWGSYAQFRIRLERQVLADYWLLSPNARQLNFDTGVSQIILGETVTGATSNASGRVARVTTQSGSWGTNAAGTLVFYSVTGGPFVNNESLRVGGVNRATPVGVDFLSDTSWFSRNEWYRLVYYATAQSHTAAQLPGTLSCVTGANCLSVANMTPPNNKRSILILAGRSIAGAARPNGNLSDFVEFDNADLNTTFEKLPVSKAIDAAAKKPFNDRIVAIDSN